MVMSRCFRKLAILRVNSSLDFPLANAVSWHTSRRASLSFVEELSTVSVANLKDTC